MPHPHFTGTQLVVATHNSGKLAEFAQLLAMPGLVYRSAADLGLAEPAETGLSFAENAALKARAAAVASGQVALADDSGLCVAALAGAPGIYSARWAKNAAGNADFAAGIAKIEALLQTKPQPASRAAAFVTTLALAWPNGDMGFAEGRVEGSILPHPRGSHGFGYDAWFMPDGSPYSFAEMPWQEKQAYSPRSRAIALLKQRYF